MRGRIGKVGVFVLALVFAIGAMGAAFASWTDTVSIEGDITTGSLGYEICGFSETWVYKVIDAYDDYDLGDMIVGDVPLDDAALLYVASANWTGRDPGLDLDNCIDGPNQSYTVVFDNLFPCPDFCADIVLHYTGTVPARISPEMDFQNNALLQELWDEGEFTMWAERGTRDGDSIVWDEANRLDLADIEGLQLEQCNYLKLWWCIHIPQEDKYMNMDADFTTTIDMVQWNEYPLPA